MATTLFDLSVSFEKLRNSTAELLADRYNRDKQMEVCLDSRSAYTDFYAESEFQQGIEGEWENQLRQLLAEAIAALPERDEVKGADGIVTLETNKYWRSVNDRLNDLKSFVDTMGRRPPLDTGIPEF